MTELRRRLFKIGPEKPGDDPGPDPETGAHGERVAQLLRRTREKHGQSLREVSGNLRIRFGYLDAIEQGRYRELPGPTYAVGFVRSYAEYLGLDGGEVVRRFKGEVEGLDSKVHLSFPEPVPEGKVAGGAILLLSLIVLAVGYGGWYLLSRGDGVVGDLVPRVTQSLRALIAGGDTAPAGGGPVASTAPTAPVPPGTVETPAATFAADPGAVPKGGTEARDQVPANSPDPTTDPSPSPPPTPIPTMAPDGSATAGSASVAAVGAEEVLGSADEWDEEPALATAPELPAIPAVPAAPAAPMTVSAGLGSPVVTGPLSVGDARVVLRARLASWIQISDASQVPLITRTLAAGEAYPVPNQPGLTLYTGNAGGLDIVVDGQVLPPLGPVGAVKRNIALDPEQLLTRPQMP